MKKLLILIIGSAWLLSGCLTVGRIQRNCDKFAAVCVQESNTETVFRDTTIFVREPVFVPVPGFKDSLRIRDSMNIIPVFEPQTNKTTHYAEMEPVHEEFGLIGVDAWVKFSKIGIDAYLTDSAIWYNYEKSLKINNAIREKTTTNTVVLPPERYVPRFHKFTFWLFWAEMAVVVLFFVLRFYSGKLYAILRKIIFNQRDIFPPKIK
jgi:hypothetical protein